MNKWVTISAVGALAIGVIVTGVLYAQENSRLKAARSEIIILEGNTSALETELTAAEAQVSALEVDLAAAKAQVSTLAAAEAQVSTLETDLAVAEAQVLTLEADLAAAETQVLTLEADLAAYLEAYTNEVTILGFAYYPETIIVPAGTTVTWTNQDSEEHTVTSDGHSGYLDGDLQFGKSFSHTFTESGIYKYHCHNHDEMEGTVIVE